MRNTNYAIYHHRLLHGSDHYNCGYSSSRSVLASNLPKILTDALGYGGSVGRIFDAYGPRVIIIPGTVVLVFSTMMTSLSSKYYQYVLTQGILFGLGVGMMYVTRS